MMTRKHGIVILFIFLITGTVFGQSDSDIPHRDDFKMNSVSGGDFRSYVSDEITEENLWANSMRTMGTFHNLMHELMSDMARYGGELHGDEHVPDFDERISGGLWTDYRKNMEQNGESSSWMDVIHVTEVMHDRVHHAMYKAILYDLETFQRRADLDEYVGEDRAPYSFNETISGSVDRMIPGVSADEFGEFSWHHDIEGVYLHGSVQKMAVFSRMLDDLIQQWAGVGSHHEEVCRPGEYGDRMSGEEWAHYAEQVKNCGDKTWSELVQISALMHQRIHHMMAVTMAHLKE